MSISFADIAVGTRSIAARVFIGLIVSALAVCSSVEAQETSIAGHLDAGEFPNAIQKANQLPMSQRDQWLSRIAQAQHGAGAVDGAFFTAQQIQDDDSRSGALGGLAGNGGVFGGGPVGGGNQFNQPGGLQGGVTLADFSPLMNLIRGTVSPESWDSDQGNGSMFPYPSGVYVSADGTLKRIKTDLSARAERLKKRAAKDSGNRVATLPSDLRMVSLTRLERAAQVSAARNLPIPPMMQNMAGLYEIKFLTVFPETGDIVIAGPAGDWEMNDQGRPVNVDTGKPVLQLDDLVVCLRNAKAEGGAFGCSINPRDANLVKTKNFLENNKLKGKQWSRALQEALGMQDIEVFGIAADTHAARVLVEADYRMKLVGMGLEESIPEVPSYFQRLTDNERQSASDVVRWWFTMNYDDVVADEERTVFAFEGTGVKVLSETEFLNQQGQRVHTGKSNAETAGFARDFTKNFSALADKYPVYRQLKNVFDLALVAGLIEKQGLAERVEWKQRFFGAGEGLTYRVRKDITPKQVSSVMNEQVVKKRKARSTVIQRIVGVSGGIKFNASEVIASPMKLDLGDLTEQKQQAVPDVDADHWWWD